MIILNAELLYKDVAFLTIIRGNPNRSYKENSDGDWYRTFQDYWRVLDQEKKNYYTSKERFRNELCVEILGMPANSTAGMEHLKTLVNNRGLNDALRDWVAFSFNRTNFRLYVFSDLSAAKLPGLISELLTSRLYDLLQVFSAESRDYVSAHDASLINHCARITKTQSGAQVPAYQKEALLNLFYPDSPDREMGCNTGALAPLTAQNIIELKKDKR